MEVDLSKYQNQWFIPASKGRILLWLFVSAILFRSSLPVPSVIKVVILRIFGAKIRQGVVIKPSVHIKYPWKLTIGKNSWIGENVWIDNLANIRVGDNCCLSQGSYLLTGNHDFTSRSFDLRISEINIENEVWVGAKSVVCPGVTLKRGSILTVGSITTKDMDVLGIYQGNPAMKIKRRIIS